MENLSETEKDETRETLKRLCAGCSACGGKFMASIWDKMPEGCKLEGWLFQEREKEKQKIRRKKEELLDLQILLKTANFDLSQEINENIGKIKTEIEIYSKYGSNDW